MYFHKKALSFKEGCTSVLSLMAIMFMSGLPFYVLYFSGLISENLTISLSYITGCLAFMVFFFKLKIKDLRLLTAAPVPFYVYPLMVIMTLCMNMVIDPFSYFYHLPDWSADTFQKLSNNKFLFFIGAVILAPVLEETIFRGLILGGMLSRYPKWQALLYSSILFSIIHLNPAQSFGAFFLGLLAGWSYIRFKNLLVPITIHFANNLLCWYLMTVTSVTNTNSFFEFFSSGQWYILSVLASFLLFAITLFLLGKQFKEPAETIR